MKRFHGSKHQVSVFKYNQGNQLFSLRVQADLLFLNIYEIVDHQQR